MPRLCAATGDGIVLLDEAGDAWTVIAFWHPTTYLPYIQREQKGSQRAELHVLQGAWRSA